MRTTRLMVIALAALTLGLSCASSPKQAPSATSGASSVAKSEASILDSIPEREGAPRTLVVYYSQGSATRRVAEDLALILKADLERIAEKRQRSTGFFGFMNAGYQATFGIPSAIEKPVRDPADYQLVLVLSPVWSWSLSPPVRAYLRLMKGRLAAAGFVSVSGDTRPERIAAAMAKESGAAALAIEGFSQKDFLPENREVYVGKIAGFVERLR